MPNWVNNIVAVKGNTAKVINWLKSGVNVPDDVKLYNLADWLNKQNISLDSFNPMPQTFKDWDTTNQMECYMTWLCGGYNDNLKKNSPLLGSQDVYKAVKAAAEEKFGEKEYTREQEDEVAKELYPQYVADYEKYCEGWKAAKKSQEETYGVVGWYDWGLQYRGTKWNADLHDWQVAVSANGNECIIYASCETAWNMPEAWLATMQKNNDDLTFFIRGDEEAQIFNGYACARNLDEWVENDTNLYNKAKNEISQEWEDEGRTTDEDDDDYDEDEFEDEVWTRQQELSNEITNRFYEYVLAS